MPGSTDRRSVELDSVSKSIYIFFLILSNDLLEISTHSNITLKHFSSLHILSLSLEPYGVIQECLKAGEETLSTTAENVLQRPHDG